jgi:two-component system, chemotaxis family, chemotaxis protein CheY
MTNAPKRILIAEDTLFFQATMRDLFERAGYTVLTASNGEEALQKIRENLPRLDVALVDLLMPKMTGFDVLRETRKLEGGRLLPVVAMTSLYHKEAHLEELRRANASGYLEKSTPPEEILYFINNLLYPAGNDNRKNLRIVAHFPVQYRLGDALFQAYTYTLSEGGLFIRTTRPAPKGDAVEVAFSLPEGRRVVAKGEVVHVQDKLDFYLYPPGMGVRFTHIAPDDQEQVRAFIGNEMWGKLPEK